MSSPDHTDAIIVNVALWVLLGMLVAWLVFT